MTPERIARIKAWLKEEYSLLHEDSQWLFDRLEAVEQENKGLTQLVDDAVTGLGLSDYADLGHDAKQIKDTMDAALEQVRKLTAENERLREALQFYANKDNYQEKEITCFEFIRSNVSKDDGRHARKALKG